jgi:HEAT repeat protein
VAKGPVAPEPVPRADGDVLFQKTMAEVDDSRFFTRKAALERLATMRPNDQRATVIQKLVQLTKKGVEPRIRALAVTALGVWGTGENVPDLLKVIDDPDDLWSRKEALKVIGRFKDPETLPAVMRCFRDSSTHTEAGDALRELGPMAEPALIAILSEPPGVRNVFVKRQAIEVLADMGTEKSVPALRTVLTSSDTHEAFHLRQPAQKALDAIAGRMKR